MVSIAVKSFVQVSLLKRICLYLQNEIQLSQQQIAFEITLNSRKRIKIHLLKMSNDHSTSRPKCYCTTTCPIPLADLKSNCTSGQLLPDLCGTCLICAKSRGQECGGLNNQFGVCGVGLKCLVRFQLKRGSHGIQEENNANGTCVSDTSDLCPGKCFYLIYYF